MSRTTIHGLPGSPADHTLLGGIELRVYPAVSNRHAYDARKPLQRQRWRRVGSEPVVAVCTAL